MKLSILQQYLRIFVPNRKSNIQLFVTIHIVIWLTLAFYIVDFVLALIERKPCEKNWIPELKGTCFDIQGTFRYTGIVNVISDFVILFLPMRCIWKLQMETKRKAFVLGIFGMGIL